MLSCRFPAETPGFALERGDSWKNADGAEEQRGTEQPARLGSQQRRSPPGDVEAGSCCLSYYLSQLLLSLWDPFKTPVHSVSPSAPSTAAANSAPLLLARFSANTPYFSCPHLSPLGISYQPASNPCLSVSLSALFAAGLAGLTTTVLASPCPDLMGSRLGVMLLSKQALHHGNAGVAVLLRANS